MPLKEEDVIKMILKMLKIVCMKIEIAKDSKHAIMGYG